MTEFEPQIWGTPNPKMSMEEYNRIIAEAKRNYQNVYFGTAWKYKDQPGIIYTTHPRMETGWRGVVASVAGWLGL